MRVLGLSAYYHDSAAALLVDGRLVAAAQEERFSRRKHDPRFPADSIRFCLAQADIRPDDIDFVAFYDKPFLKFERLLETYLAFAPRGRRSFSAALPIWIHEKIFQKTLLKRELERIGFRNVEPRLLFAEHHQSHAASAYFPSPFAEAVVLTMDGVGEWATTSVSIGRRNELTPVREIHFPHSLGLLYSAFTAYLGFLVNSDEYKVMGLAPYGTPRFAMTILDNLIDVKADGSFRLNLDFFDYCTGLRMTNRRFEGLFGRQTRQSHEPLHQFHMDVAASIQDVTDQVLLRLTRGLADEFRLPNLCVAGGVALNCVSNGKVLRDRRFDGIWIQPAPGDAGGAVGAAYAAYHDHAKQPRITTDAPDGMSASLLGPSFSQREIEQRLRTMGATFEVEPSDASMIARTVDALESQQVVGWFQGRMEFGPRALGARSILADPRSASMQYTVNNRVKFRESFRPFAPAVLAEDVSEWFDLDTPSPYMLFVANVQASRCRSLSEQDRMLIGIERIHATRSEIPAVTHVDHSARVQTVDSKLNPLFHQLLNAFKVRTNCPVLLNTSFNVHGEPIVCTPEDAFRSYLSTDIDVLVMGQCILRKNGHARVGANTGAVALGLG